MKKFAAIAAFLFTAAAPATAQDEPADRVSQDRLKADVEALVGFGTRHTLSSQTDPKRGIGAARKWGENEFRAISDACGNCLEIVLPERMVQGRRIPEPTRLVNVVAIQRGTQRPNEVVIVQGHIDSRATDAFDAVSDAPGANDDASGTALVIEAARALAGREYPTTIVYALLSGEEQGLYGGRLLADYAEQQGWTVKAVLNNDVVGNSCGSDGYCDPDHVRVFSEGPRADLTEDVRAAQRRSGGENDSPSRNLSRWLDDLADETPGGLDIRQIWRVDRMGRGGDQIPFVEKGYPAIRFSVAVEDYEHQHQDLRTEDGVVYGDTVDEMDFAYLARVTQLNVRALDKLSQAAMPPAPTAQAAVQTFTRIAFPPVAGATSYRIVRRRTDNALWDKDWAFTLSGALDDTDPAVFMVVSDSDEGALTVVDGMVTVDLTGIRGDDWFFGVQSCADSGVCSPFASAVPGGQFAPIPQSESAED